MHEARRCWGRDGEASRGYGGEPVGLPGGLPGLGLRVD